MQERHKKFYSTSHFESLGSEQYINTLLACIETPLTENRAYEDNVLKFQEGRARDHIILYKRHVVQFR